MHLTELGAEDREQREVGQPGRRAIGRRRGHVDKRVRVVGQQLLCVSVCVSVSYV